MVSESRANPEVFQTGNPLGNQAVASYVFCTHRRGPRVPLLEGGSHFPWEPWHWAWERARLLFSFPQCIFCCSARGSLLVCRSSLGLRVTGQTLSCTHMYIPCTHTYRCRWAYRYGQGLEFKSQSGKLSIWGTDSRDLGTLGWGEWNVLTRVVGAFSLAGIPSGDGTRDPPGAHGP